MEGLKNNGVGRERNLIQQLTSGDKMLEMQSTVPPQRITPQAPKLASHMNI